MKLPFAGSSILRFGISLLVMAGLTFGIARVALPPGTAPAASKAPGPNPADVNAGFVTVPNPSGQASPLGPPPEDQVIQLVSFNKDAPPPSFGERAPWWTSSGIPRVQMITQFDNQGSFTGVNCVMASGAMLAQLGYGIMTTGSQMRSLLRPQHGGGTTLFEMAQVIRAGWDVPVRLGVISPLMLRALMNAGAGAVIIVNYGIFPVSMRNQKDFTGFHAMYIDAVRFSADGSQAEYYVMDPIGRPSRGYNGEWWPADLVEKAAQSFGHGFIATAWAFAGGIVPHGNYPTLPPANFPADDRKPGKHPTQAPIAVTPAPSESAPADVSDPIGDPGPPPPSGDPDVSVGPGQPPIKGGVDLSFFLGLCVQPNKPSFCPPGVPAVYPTAKAPPPTVPPLVGKVPLDLLYTDTPQPGIWRTIIDAPPGVDPAFSYWPADGSGPALDATPLAATLGGKNVWVVQVQVTQPSNFAFVASTNQGGSISTSQIGQILLNK